MAVEALTSLDGDTEVPASACCECGYVSDRAGGNDGTAPKEGDAALCIKCGSLNFYGADLRQRRPTEAEMLEAASDPEIQRLRRIILRVNRDYGNKTE